MPELTPLTVFRLGIAPRLSTPALDALAAGLRANDPRLIEDQTTHPRCLTGPGHEGDGIPCAGACTLAYALQRGDGLQTIAALEDACNGLLMSVNAQLRTHLHPRPVSIFVGWWDDPTVPRWRKLRLLLRAVEKVIAQRKETHHATGA